MKKSKLVDIEDIVKEWLEAHPEYDGLCASPQPEAVEKELAWHLYTLAEETRQRQQEALKKENT